MPLTEEQRQILVKCLDFKSGAIPVAAFQGRQYLISAEGQFDALRMDGECVQGLFSAGLLEWQSTTTVKLTIDGEKQATALSSEQPSSEVVK